MDSGTLPTTTDTIHITSIHLQLFIMDSGTLPTTTDALEMTITKKHSQGKQKTPRTGFFVLVYF